MINHLSSSQLFREQFYPKNTFVEHIKIMFDGSCGPINPDGNMGYGYAIFNEQDGDVLAEGWGYTIYDGRETTSNNVSEWYALKIALEHLEYSGYSYKELTICGDSMLVIRQLKNEWGIKEGAYTKVAKSTISQFGNIIKSAKIHHVYREDNDYCDELSNKYISYLMDNYNIDTGGEFKKKAHRKKKISK